jgi:hypothetical protein
MDGVSFESWVDRQVREAIERGEFDNLAGAGKPLQLSDDPDWWIKAKLAREDLGPLMPTPLALKREAERVDQSVADMVVEAEVRAIVEDLNARIKESYLGGFGGPRIIVGLVDVEAVVARWRAGRC